MTLLKSCIITDSSAYIVEEYTDYHPYILLHTKNIYSVCPGIVVLKGSSNRRGSDRYKVIIQYDNEHYFGYGNLTNVSVEVGDRVDYGDIIGSNTSSIKEISFEYYTIDKSKYPVYPVRIGNNTFYKQNPTRFMTEGYESIVSYSDNMKRLDNIPWALDPEFTPTMSRFMSAE